MWVQVIIGIMFQMGLVVILTVLVKTSMPRQGSNYCRMSYQHTMCTSPGPGPACRGGVMARGVSTKEAGQIVALHNAVRGRVARGEEHRGRPGPQPSASNMRQVYWDPELAAIAQRHADQCRFAHDCSACRRVSRFGVGQNLYLMKQSLRAQPHDWRRAVKDWYNEVRLFSRNQVQPFSFSTSIGHYSQMIWADTDRVGCGATTYREGGWYVTLYTCNYGPSGNYIRGQMYRTGRSCSSCPVGSSCSYQYPGLCR